MKSENERYLDAKYALHTAVVKLMENKEWNELSVTEICREAGINRSTFYAHYNNIYDLIVDTRQSFVDFMLKLNEKFINNPMMDNDPLLEYLKLIAENKKLYKIYTLRFPELRKTTEEEDKITAFLESSINRSGFNNSEQTDYLSEFYIGGTLAVVSKWLKNDCRESPEFIRDCILKIISEHSRQ